MEGFETYRKYLALKRHFTTDYNYFKYRGKVRVSEASFAKRNDRYIFQKIEKKYTDNVQDFLLANLLKDQSAWIGNFSEEVYLEWRKISKALGYRVEQDLLMIKEYMTEHDVSFTSLFKADGSQHPPLLKMFVLNWIHINTMCALEVVIHYVDGWEHKHIDPLSSEQIDLIRNYLGFLSLDRRRFVTLLKKVIC